MKNWFPLYCPAGVGGYKSIELGRVETLSSQLLQIETVMVEEGVLCSKMHGDVQNKHLLASNNILI